MSGLSSLRRLATAAVLVASVSAVTLWAQSMAPAGGAPATAPASTTAPMPTASGPAMPPPGTAPDPNAPIARINGRDINTRAFIDILMRVDGMRVFSVVLDLSLAQGACQGAGVPLDGPVFKKRLDDELDKTMDGLNISKTDNGKPDGKPITHDQRVNILGALLQQQGKSVVEFRLWLETRAELRALAEPNVKAEQAELDDAYTSEYGEKRRVHIMTWPDTVKVSEITAALATNRPDGKKMTPEDVAGLLHLPAPAVWQISSNAKNIDKIRGIAFDVLKSVGQVSAETDVPVGDKSQKVLIVLDEITPDSKATHPLSQVKEELTQKIIDAKQNAWMDQHLMSLRAQANIEIKDPVLSEEVQTAELQRQAMIKAQQAATQSATLPGSMPATMPTPASAPK